MFISVVIPAFDEEAYLCATLESVGRAAAALSGLEGVSAEVLVVDNDSSDATAEVARALGATVLREALRNVAAVRNTGARRARGDVLVVPSTRRFDQWRLWRTLVWTNPLFIFLFRRRPSAWRGWYERAPR